MKLTPAMRRSLEDGVRHGDVCHSLSGQAAHGGWQATRAALVRRGLIDPKTLDVTDAGRDALKNGK